MILSNDDPSLLAVSESMIYVYQYVSVSLYVYICVEMMDTKCSQIAGSDD
jgi:hypothetical protein